MLATDSRSDAELHLTALLAAQRRDELVALGRHGMAGALAHLAAEAAETLVERRQLRRAVEDSMAVTTSLPVEAEPQDLERDRRLAVAVAEVEAESASLAATVLRCPKGDKTAARLWVTSAGVLLEAVAPLPHHPVAHPRAEDPRPIPFASLLDGAGRYEVFCARCEKSFRLDPAAVLAAVRARRTMYRAT